jgi:putative alpha-1,2-mannosidase
MLITRLLIRSLSALVLVPLFFGCQADTEPADYVDPFIGTGGHGHTFPGATLPFGMVQLSPDTRKDSWDGCSGYHYSDNTIIGFSHTHLSGTGVGDYGDIRLMPMTGKLITVPGKEEDPSSGYRSRFSHNNETASRAIIVFCLRITTSKPSSLSPNAVDFTATPLTATATASF